jgi:hypothetical protein
MNYGCAGREQESLQWATLTAASVDPALEKQIPFGSAQGRLSHQKKGARNDKVKVAHSRKPANLSVIARQL